MVLVVVIALLYRADLARVPSGRLLAQAGAVSCSWRIVRRVSCHDATHLYIRHGLGNCLAVVSAATFGNSVQYSSCVNR